MEDICSPRSIFQQSAEINSFSVDKKQVVHSLIYFLVNNVICRSSLNAKSATITKKPFAGSSITSGSMLMKPVMILLKLVENMSKGSLGYVHFFSPLSLLFFCNNTGKLRACYG